MAPKTRAVAPPKSKMHPQNSRRDPKSAVQGKTVDLGGRRTNQENIFLVWTGRRVVVLATGPLTAADVLALYGDLVPAP